jgi:hypothetical protein
MGRLARQLPLQRVLLTLFTLSQEYTNMFNFEALHVFIIIVSSLSLLTVVHIVCTAVDSDR